jgi:hypothetical protein
MSVPIFKIWTKCVQETIMPFHSSIKLLMNVLEMKSSLSWMDFKAIPRFISIKKINIRMTLSTLGVCSLLVKCCFIWKMMGHVICISQHQTYYWFLSGWSVYLIKEKGWSSKNIHVIFKVAGTIRFSWILISVSFVSCLGDYLVLSFLSLVLCYTWLRLNQ